ncbi:RecB family exonuclease [Salinibacter ruber]|uniref:PD-(D/E)XK nuclease family protein n=1 Tax=Salinibacter ruber TaxID=146919 RepID=UPI002168C216|nr:PD-(D/E)XK nuclease family protein [Salinibacter ruber]MCS3940340.1 RecB family exonuclease [Salinibacter ruber]
MNPDSDFHLQIGQLCEDYPIASKVLLVNRTQHGRAILNRLALQREGWVGLEAMTPLQLARSLTKDDLQAEEQYLPDGFGPVLAGESLRRLSSELKEALGGSSPAISVPLSRTFEELRLQGIDASTYLDFQKEAPLRHQAKAEAYAEYEKLLSEGGYVDKGELFERAVGEVRSRGQMHGQVFAVLDTVQLPALTFEFLQTIRTVASADSSGTFLRVGSSNRTEEASKGSPSNTAARLFADAGTPGDFETESEAPSSQKDRVPEEPYQPTFWTTVGAESEVEAVFQNILRSEASYDDVELAYADPDPYRTVVETVAERHDVPITLSAGRPAMATSVGQSLQGVLEWISGGLEVATLIRLLRGGLLRVDRVVNEVEELDSSRAATLLAEQRYAPGPQGYFDALRRRQEEVESSISERSGTDDQIGRDLREIKALRSLTGELMKIIPDPEVTIAEMAQSCKKFLETFGPVDKPPADLPKDQRSPAQAARGRIMETFGKLGGAPATGTLPRTQATKQLQRLVNGMFVKASGPKPGHVHVVPLEAAGYAGRKELFTIGLDGESTSATAAEDPLLTDEERRRLEEKNGHPVRQAQKAGDRKSWLLGRGLSRHKGSLLLSTRTFDLAEGKEIAPSPLYLKLRERKIGQQNQGGNTPEVMENLSDRHVTLLVDPELPLLGDTQAWRAAEMARRNEMKEGLEELSSREDRIPVREGEMSSLKPWIVSGRQAEQRRQSDTYTAFDGMLAGEMHSGLDVLDPSYSGVLSASRLETLAASPYAYFLKYVLGVRPLDEPALDDVLWIDRRKQGTVLHETFRAFMESLEERGEMPAAEHEEELIQELENQLGSVRNEIEPPSEAVAEDMKRRLAEDARVFLESEIDSERRPYRFELGFGSDDSPHRENDHGPATIDLGDGVSFKMRGQIDRINQGDSGELVIWDYKTGSKSPYEGDDAPLQKGEMLQWALYAYAAEDLLEASVRSSGYFFTSTKELGKRISHDPNCYREKIGELLKRLSKVSRSGCFPMNLDSTPWMFGDYDRIVPDTERREEELDQKTYPEDSPAPPHLDE